MRLRLCFGRPRASSLSNAIAPVLWQAVDQWHLDSVPYVMVLLLSDATDMEGEASTPPSHGVMFGG